MTQSVRVGNDLVPAPANVVLQCAPPDKDKWLRPGQFAVNDVDKMEAITQPLYSYQSYPAAGAQRLVFFQAPASGAVTREDTNMELAGQLPAPQKFLVQGIGIDYLPGIAPTRFGAQAATGWLNDFAAIMRRGRLVFIIGSKEYLSMAPIGSMPPRSHLNGSAAAADQSTIAAALQTFASVAYADGDVFKPNPLLLEASQNFRVEIEFPGGVVPIPSADVGARIGVLLYGTLYRSPQ